MKMFETMLEMILTGNVESLSKELELAKMDNENMKVRLQLMEKQLSKKECKQW